MEIYKWRNWNPQMKKLKTQKWRIGNSLWPLFAILWKNFASKSQMCRTTLIRSALKTICLVAFFDDSNVESPIGTDLATFEVAGPNNSEFSNEFLSINFKMVATSLLQNLLVQLQVIRFWSQNHNYNWTRQDEKILTTFDSALCDTSASLWNSFCKNESKMCPWKVMCRWSTNSALPQVSRPPKYILLWFVPHLKLLKKECISNLWSAVQEVWGSNFC